MVFTIHFFKETVGFPTSLYTCTITFYNHGYMIRVCEVVMSCYVSEHRLISVLPLETHSGFNVWKIYFYRKVGLPKSVNHITNTPNHREAAVSVTPVLFSGLQTTIGALIQYKRCRLTSIGNPVVEIRRSSDRLISTMGFPILVRWYLYIESAPWWHKPLLSQGFSSALKI